jgi:hypothetical protein
MKRTCVLHLEMPNDANRGRRNETFKALKLHHLLYGLHVLNVCFFPKNIFGGERVGPFHHL